MPADHMRQRSGRTTKVLVLVATNIVSLLVLGLVGEVAMRWRTEGGFRPAIASFVGRRSPLAAYDTKGWLVRDPDIGYKLNPAGSGVNALGLRHPPLDPTKPSDLFRILLLGDSVAWAERGFVDLLRTELARRYPGKVEVINASVPGYTTYQERRFLERDLLRLAPDVVLLEYCVNDNHQFLHFLNENRRWLMMPDIARTLLPEDPSILRRVASFSYLWFEVQHRLLSLKLTARSRFPWDDRPDLRTAWIDTTWAATRDHIRSMRRATDQAGGRFAVVAVPLEDQLRPDLLALDLAYTLKPQNRLRAICEDAGIPFLDLFSSFAARHGAPLYRDGLHLTPAGHAAAALSIQQFLSDQHLLPSG